VSAVLVDRKDALDVSRGAPECLLDRIADGPLGSHAVQPCETLRGAADGKTLFFMRTSDADAPLFSLPLAGGPERKVLDCVPYKGFAVGPGGVYHLSCVADRRIVPLYLLDPATGQDRLLGNLEKPGSGITVTPDGKTILYTKLENPGSDLMMIENFR
jgi:Tol biopolymer transport system component